MITTPRPVSTGTVSAPAPAAAVESSQPAAGTDFMGLLLLLMGVGTPVMPPQGPSRPPTEVPGDLVKDPALSEDDGADASMPSAGISGATAGPTVGEQPWTVPGEIYASTAPAVSGQGKVDDTAAPIAASAIAAAINTTIAPAADHAVVASGVQASTAVEGNGKATALPLGASLLSPTPAEAPAAPSATRNESAVPAAREELVSAIATDPAADRGGDPRPRRIGDGAGPAAGPVAPLPPSADPTRAVAVEGKPAAFEAAVTAAAGQTVTASVTTRQRAQTASPPAEHEPTTRSAPAARETSAAQPTLPATTIVAAGEMADPRDDRQPPGGKHHGETSFAIETPAVYPAHLAQDVAGSQTITRAAPVDGSAPALPPRFVEQIVHSARLVVNEGVTRMDVQLEPPTLGTVRVSASATADTVGLTLSADRPETRALLEQAIPQIQAALSVRGVTTASIAVVANFEPPDARRAPFRRDGERGDRGAQHPREHHRPAAEQRAIGLVNLTV